MCLYVGVTVMVTDVCMVGVTWMVTDVSVCWCYRDGY